MSQQEENKGPSVRRMFDAIAGRYDLMNRVMTMGQDQKWRQFVVDKAGDPKGGWVLDLATGTGDIACLTQHQYREAQIIGADFAWNMLGEAKKRFADLPIGWQSCDANMLPYQNAVFQSVTFGYLLRNVDDVSRVLREVQRTLKPGGRVVCLDTTPPAKNVLYPFINLYLKYIVPLLGRLIAGDEAAYGYLTGSTMEFYSAEELAEKFRRAGFVKVGYRKFMMGTIGIHWGEKDDS